MKALIDADILVYRVGFTTEQEPEGIALSRMDESIGSILKALDTVDYRCYITSQDKSNFRYEIYPEYKANRKDFVKPIHYDCLRNHLLNVHGAEEVFGQEADDALGISSGPETCIVSIDKDLNQIEGKHFNFVKGYTYTISPEEGLRNFYRQLLTGDMAVDNVPGLAGIGTVKSNRIIGERTGNEELYEVVLNAYTEKHKEEAYNLILRNGRLLWIRRKEGELWYPPDIPARKRTNP